MMEKITIKQIWLNDTKKDGTPYLDKQQRPYKGVRIVTTDGRSIWGRGYTGSPVLGWKVGDIQEIDIESAADGFLSFRLPKRGGSPELDTKLNDMQRAIDLLNDRVTELENRQDKDLEPEDIPFDNDNS